MLICGIYVSNICRLKMMSVFYLTTHGLLHRLKSEYIMLVE